MHGHCSTLVAIAAVHCNAVIDSPPVAYHGGQTHADELANGANKPTFANRLIVAIVDNENSVIVNQPTNQWN